MGSSGTANLSGFSRTKRLRGYDTFHFYGINDSSSSSYDVITDFEDGTDKISLYNLVNNGDIAGFSDLTISNNGTDITVTANDADFELILSGVYTLDQTDFVF